VRKDLLENFRKTYPVPTYVIEFLTWAVIVLLPMKQEIQEGLEIVKRQLQDRTVRPGEEEYFKSKAREKGSIKLIDIITAKLGYCN
jgi:ATP-dependent Lon protease